MKRRNTILLTGILIATIAFAFTKKHSPEPKNATGGGFALIELYTSEGCSSCPPADKLLAKIAQEYKDKEVYVLAYHVDYWNRLGWKDVFSNPQYSARQNEYAKYLKSADGVYTPQAIVNGKTEFIGSEEEKMRAAIGQALIKKTTVNLNLNTFNIAAGKALINYQVSGDISGNSLVFAVVKNHAETQVKAGENNGRTLPHINIVQQLKALPLKADTGNADISLPDGYNTRDWSIIAFMQNNHTGEIIVARKAGPVTNNIAIIK